MTTTQTQNVRPTNGTTTTKKRERKKLDAKGAGIKISAILDALPEADRAKALHIAKTLSEPVAP